MIVDLVAIAASAVECLMLELETWPKPGLVSHVDRGSHVDMDASTFRRSAATLEPYFVALAAAGAHRATMAELRTIGREAELAMLATTSGVNTHRGAIFGLGLLCAAAAARAHHVRARSLGAVVSHLWGTRIDDEPQDGESHGSVACRRFGAGGARLEARRGFPTIYEVGLPALRRARAVAPDSPEAQRVEACFALIAATDDTNLLYRGGLPGLTFARREARRFLDGGGIAAADWRVRACATHEQFRARRLSPGGAADLLAMTLFVAIHERAGATRR
jgi:triphosphoribosyl-dephospho-CoA synthase